MKIKKKICKTLVLFLPLIALLGCGGSGGTGTLSVGLTDAPNEDFAAVYVTIKEVQIHAIGQDPESESGWITLGTPNRTFDLLELTNGVVEGLAEGALEAGSYTQMRLIIDDVASDGTSNLQCHPHPFPAYVIGLDGVVTPIKVPSGPQTGIKIICPGMFDIAANRTTEVVLDFDAAASITPSFNLKPVIKCLGTESFSIVNGVVSLDDGDPNTLDDDPIIGADISAQLSDPELRVQTSTTSQAPDGSYELFLRPNNYNLVAVADGHAPAAVNFDAIAGEVKTVNFLLLDSPMGILNGTVTIDGITEPTFAHLSVRQDSILAGEVVEVASTDVLSGTGYEFNLPLLPDPDYDVVASTCDQVTQVLPVNVPVLQPLHINFPPLP